MVVVVVAAPALGFALKLNREGVVAAVVVAVGKLSPDVDAVVGVKLKAGVVPGALGLAEKLNAGVDESGFVVVGTFAEKLNPPPLTPGAVT